MTVSVSVIMPGSIGKGAGAPPASRARAGAISRNGRFVEAPALSERSEPKDLLLLFVSPYTAARTLATCVPWLRINSCSLSPLTPSSFDQ